MLLDPTCENTEEARASANKYATQAKQGEETEIAIFFHVLMMEAEMRRARSEMPITDHEGGRRLWHHLL
jgi:hypothetical protein